MADWTHEQHAVSKILHEIVDRAGVPMLIGGTTNDFTTEGYAPLQFRPAPPAKNRAGRSLP